MWLQTRMFLLVAVLFGILYGVVTGLGVWMGAGSAVSYIILAFVFLGTSDKLMELFTTHPNMLKRIKHLSTLAV